MIPYFLKKILAGDINSLNLLVLSGTTISCCVLVCNIDMYRLLVSNTV